MLRIGKFGVHGFSCNSYFLTADEKNFVVIDPGQKEVFEEAKEKGMNVPFVLLTHGHFDHIRGCAAFQAAGAKIGCMKGEEEIALFHNLGEVYGDGPVMPFQIDFTFQDRDVLNLCGISFEVISSPGHSRGGACFLVKTEQKEFAPGVLFTGDTLFFASYGRTDGPTGSEEELFSSLGKLLAIEENYNVLAGHGRATTLSLEKKHFGYLK